MITHCKNRLKIAENVTRGHCHAEKNKLYKKLSCVSAVLRKNSIAVIENANKKLYFYDVKSQALFWK